jgi:hypothetical protein
VNPVLLVFFFFFPLGRTAQVAAGLAAELAEGAVRARMFLRHLLIHAYILLRSAMLRPYAISAYDILLRNFNIMRISKQRPAIGICA